MILSHFLDEDFDKEYLSLAASIKTDEYYINMMIAWLFATSLAKKYEETIPFIEGGYLSSDVLNKTIQKAVESYRIKDEDKIYLRSLKVKK